MHNNNQQVAGWLVCLFFLLLDEGRGAYTHHLPADTVEDCFLASATEMRCRLVVDDSARRTDAILFFRSIGVERVV